MNVRAQCCVIVSLGGCWSDRALVTHAVWSDDDAEQAYVEVFYEEETFTLDSAARRNWQVRVMVQEPDGSERRAVTSKRSLQHGGDFFYMRQEGYLLLDVIDGDELRWEAIDAGNGSIRTVYVSEDDLGPCPVREIIPSPDGKTLARIVGSLADPTTTDAFADCTGGTIAIDLLDTETLAVEASFEVTVDGWLERTWTRQGDLHVWDQNGGSWRLDPVDGKVSNDPPECTWPRTSSSPMSSDGVLISPGTIDDPIRLETRSAPNCW